MTGIAGSFCARLGVGALVLSAALAARAAPAADAAPTGAQRWKAECGSCHVAYAPKLLSAETWRRVMSGLEKHFGTDASVDPASAAAITAYLEQNTRRRDGTSSATLRITDTSRFQRKHEELPAGTFSRPAIKSAANCAACHAGAEDGDFSERNVRIPR